MRGVMALTRNCKETIQIRAHRDRVFHNKLLREAIGSLIAGDVQTAKIVLRDYIDPVLKVKKARVRDSKVTRS